MTRSLPTRRLEVGYEDVSTLPLRDLPWIGCLEEEIDGLSQVREGVFDGTVAELRKVRKCGPVTADHDVGFGRGALRVASAARRR